MFLVLFLFCFYLKRCHKGFVVFMWSECRYYVVLGSHHPTPQVCNFLAFCVDLQLIFNVCLYICLYVTLYLPMFPHTCKWRSLMALLRKMKLEFIKTSKFSTTHPSAVSITKQLIRNIRRTLHTCLWVVYNSYTVWLFCNLLIIFLWWYDKLLLSRRFSTACRKTSCSFNCCFTTFNCVVLSFRLNDWTAMKLKKGRALWDYQQYK